MTAGAPGPADWQQAWVRALDEVELDARETERLLAGLHAGVLDAAAALAALQRPWAPPVGLGPLPDTLEERARIVLARQLEVAAKLAAAAVQSRRQLAYTRGADLAPPSRPLFVDAAC